MNSDTSNTRKRQDESSSSEVKRYTIVQTRNSFIIECRGTKTTKIDNKLVIDRKTQVIKQCNLDYKEDDLEHVQTNDALLGIIQIQDLSFLLVVKEKQTVATLLNLHEIYEIKEVEFIQFSNQPLSKEIKEYMEGIQQILKNNHYFSYTYQLNLSRNRINSDQNNEDIFCWNSRLSNSFSVYNVDQHWIVKMIQGYVGQFTYTFKRAAQTVKVTLICRRSCKRGGTRYIHRGVDSDGYVANFCENEQLLESNEYLFSNILLRGSVPIFWEQTGVQANLKLTRGEKLNEQAYEKHFGILEKMYFEGLARGCVHIFNLMMQNDKYEQMLNQSYESNHSMYQQKYKEINSKENSIYNQFDFHKRASDLDEYVYNVMQNTQGYSYYKESKVSQKLYDHQIGFFRVNCKDCLDRTNSFLMRIAYYQLEKILLQELNIQFLPSNDDAIQTHKIYDVQHPFIQQLKQLWVENGNSISNLYAGTDSTTKKASSGFQYKLNAYVIGMKRFVNGNLNDSFKMECINLITCQHHGSKSSQFDQELPDDVKSALELKRDQFYQEDKIKVQIVSWNVMTLVPQPEIQFKNLFDRETEELPDIIVVGLQEIVKVSKFKIQNLFGNKHDEKVTKLWTQIIQRHINEQVDKSYMLIHSCDMMGNFLLVYVNPSIKGMIKNVETETVKCGLAKKAADVGGVICRLTIQETSICFVHCILPGGKSKKKIQQRYEALNHIHNIAFQKDSNGKTKTNRIDQSDLIFLFGDLNFRVDLDYDTAHEMIKTYEYYIKQDQREEAENQINQLMKNDQLYSTDHLKNQSSIEMYQESPISFPPNYIDRSKKKRPPSWRGRILFSLNDTLSTISQRFYNVNNMSQESDHKPIRSYFHLMVSKIDFEKRNTFLQEIFREKGIINDSQTDISSSQN